MAAWLGDTAEVDRASSIDPAVVELYGTTGSVGTLVARALTKLAQRLELELEHGRDGDR